MFFREALMWKRLTHPNIVPFVGVTVDPPQIALEWMPRGDLATYIKSDPHQDRVSLVSQFLCFPTTLPQFSLVVRCRKGPGLYPLSWRDPWRPKGGECLKYPLMASLIGTPQPNILVDDSGHANITDFGLAQDTLGVVSKPECLSVRWTAPEVLSETGKPSMKADVFSFGMVMVEVCYNSTAVCPPQVNCLLTSIWYKAFTGAAPFSDRISPAAMVAIISGDRPPRPTHSTFTGMLWELMNQCWDQDKHGRPRMLEVLLALNPLVYERTRPIGSPPITADVLALVSDIRQRLEDLDPSNEEYRLLLYGLLSHRDLESHINSLLGDDLRGFVELLDKVGRADIHRHQC